MQIAQTERTTIADEKIKADVVDQFYWDVRIDASKINVTVENGEVKLTGEVPSFTAKQAVTDDTWAVNGVRFVDNALNVKLPEKMNVPTDEQIHANVKNQLLLNPDLAAYKINISVTDGWVTLEGTVDAFWEKLQAETDALGVQGVMGVTNKLAVVPSTNITDERIAEDVVSALDRNSRVNVEDVDVTVQGGKVNLDGTVSSWSAKTAAYNSALYTLGVTDVEDNLIVNYLTA